MKYIWKQDELIEKFKTVARKFNLTIQQAQMLLVQERFIARLASTNKGKNFIFKGGGLILRCYQKLEIPRYTVEP